METYFRSYIEILKMELDRLDFYHIEQILDVILNARKNNQQIFIIGNGGSATTASHIACDLAKGTIDPKEDDFRRFRIISLTDNMALFTAIANDLTYDDVFVEQLKNLLNPNDIVIAITASGNSPNIIKAIRFAKQQGAITIGVLGFGGGIANKLVDYQLTIASQNYGIAEDFHLIAGHIISQMLQKILKRESYPVVFLDRDGVINQKAAEHDYIKNWEEFRFIPGVIKGLNILRSLNFRLIVISNQRGIARRLFPESDLKDIHDRMLQEFRKDNIEIDKIYYCPHNLKDECNCRKPALGLFYRAQNEASYLIDFPQSYLIGDSATDIEAGIKLGVKTVLIQNGTDGTLTQKPNFIVNDLLDFAETLRELTVIDQHLLSESNTLREIS